MAEQNIKMAYHLDSLVPHSHTASHNPAAISTAQSVHVPPIPSNDNQLKLHSQTKESSQLVTRSANFTNELKSASQASGFCQPGTASNKAMVVDGLKSSKQLRVPSVSEEDDRPYRQDSANSEEDSHPAILYFDNQDFSHDKHSRAHKAAASPKLELELELKLDPSKCQPKAGHESPPKETSAQERPDTGRLVDNKTMTSCCLEDIHAPTTNCRCTIV